MAPENVKKAMASGSNIIGHLVWYDCENANITPSHLKRLFDKHGLDQDRFFPDRIKPKNAFQKACRKAMVDSSTTSDTRRSIVKLITDASEKLIYGVVDLDVDENDKSIDPSFSDRVWFNKGSLDVEFDKGHTTSKNIKRIYDQLIGEYTTRDISRMIVRGMDKMCSVSLRRAGVVYFVPARFEQDLQALQAVVNEIGDNHFQTFALGSDEGNAQGVHQAAKSQINGKIEAMKKDIAELKHSMESGTLKGKSAENSVAVRLRRFQELKERCEILADALHVKADTLTGNLAEVATMIKRELTEAA